MRCSILVTVAGVTFKRGQGAVREPSSSCKGATQAAVLDRGRAPQHSLRPRMVQPAYLGQREAGRLVR